MVIKTNGNVGIGTLTPSQLLDVAGKIRMRTQTASSDSDDTVATKGYVDEKEPFHIGTSPPANTNLLWIDEGA